MFGKLALRNVRRSARDYLVYVLTMTFVVSLMFAFNSIIFSKDLQKMYEMAAIMAAMIGIATFFIVLIVAYGHQLSVYHLYLYPHNANRLP